MFASLNMASNVFMFQRATLNWDKRSVHNEIERNVLTAKRIRVITKYRSQNRVDRWFHRANIPCRSTKRLINSGSINFHICGNEFSQLVTVLLRYIIIYRCIIAIFTIGWISTTNTIQHPLIAACTVLFENIHTSEARL